LGTVFLFLLNQWGVSDTINKTHALWTYFFFNNKKEEEDRIKP